MLITGSGLGDCLAVLGLVGVVALTPCSAQTCLPLGLRLVSLSSTAFSAFRACPLAWGLLIFYIVLLRPLPLRSLHATSPSFAPRGPSWNCPSACWFSPPVSKSESQHSGHLHASVPGRGLSAAPSASLGYSRMCLSPFTCPPVSLDLPLWGPYLGLPPSWQAMVPPAIS